MATTIQKILDIQVNYNQAIQGIAEYNRQLEIAKKFEKDLNDQRKKGTIGEQEYRERMAASKQETAQINNAKRLLEKTTRDQISAQRAEVGSLEQLRAQLRSATQEYDKMSAAERNGARGQELKAHINSITTELKTAEAQTQRFYRNVGNYKEAAMGLNNLSMSAMNLGRTLMQAFGGFSIALIARQLVQVGTDFEDAMAKVRAVTNASTNELAMMRAEARRLGEETRYTATQAAEGLEILVRGGFSAAEATTALSSTLQLAQANTIEMSEAADIVIRTLRGFKMEVNEENITKVSDSLSYAASHSATNISEMAEAFKNASPFASALGLGLDEVSAALGVLADRGVRGSDAGTAMRMVLLGLANPTSQAGKLFEKYGIQIDETSLKTEGLAGVLKTLNESGIMQSEKSIAELSDIFGRRAVTNVMSLMGSLDEFDTKLNEVANNAAGTTQRMFDQSFSGFSVASATLKSAWESLLITIWSGNDVEAIYREKMASLDAELERKKSEIEQQGESGELSGQEQIEALNEAQRQYDEARVALEEETQNQMTESSFGLQDMLQGPIEAITEGIRWVRENFMDLVTLIAGIIASFSLQSIVAKIKSTTELSKSTIITNAQTATTKVNQLAQQEATQRANIEQLKRQAETATETERTVLNNKRKIEEAQLAETEVQLHKAKAEEIKAVETAAAYATGTGWQRGMMTAKVAVQGFVKAANTAMKSFIFTAIITLAIELIMEIDKQLSSSSEEFRAFKQAVGDAVKKGLQILVKWIGDAIKWFTNLWKSSVTVRKGIYGIKAVFVTLWTVASTIIKQLVENFKMLGTVISLVGSALKNLFAGEWSAAWNDVKKLGAETVKFFNKSFASIKAAGSEIADEWKEDMDAAAQEVTDAASSASSSKGGGGGSSGGGVGTVNADDLGGGGGSATGGKGGRGKRGGRGGNDADKEKREAEKREKELNKVYEEAEKELQKLTLELMGETADKRKQKIIDQYNNEKKAIEQKLAETKKLLEDPKLTADQRKLAEEAVKSWEAALAKIPDAQKKALDLLEMEEKDRQAKLQQELAKAELDNIKVNGEEQLNRRLELQKEQQKQQELMEENALKKRLMSAEITEDQYNKLLTQLKEKHRQQEKQLEEKHTQDLNALRKKALQDRINAIKASQSEEEAVRFLARTKALYGSEEFYQAELNRLKGAKKEELTATYEAATSRLEQLRTEGNERLAAIDEQGRLEEETEAEFQARRKAAMDEYMSSRMATDTEFATQVQEADKALAQARLDIDNAMIEQQLANLSEKDAALLRAQYDSASQSLQMLEERGKLENQTQAEYDAELVAAKQEKLNAIIKINDAQVKNEQAKAQAMKAVTQSLTQLLDQLGDENSAFAKLSKIITLAQIAIDTGRALSAGIASASSLPFPANLAAIATTVATILANVATAISTVKSAKFAQGGKVTGPGTGTSDDIPAMLSNGEFVMNARSTRLFEPLLTAMNNIGRGVPIQVANSYQPISGAEMMTASFTEAAQEIRPVVSVVDVTDMQNKVEVIQNLDTF